MERTTGFNLSPNRPSTCAGTADVQSAVAGFRRLLTPANTRPDPTGASHAPRPTSDSIVALSKSRTVDVSWQRQPRPHHHHSHD